MPGEERSRQRRSLCAGAVGAGERRSVRRRVFRHLSEAGRADGSATPGFPGVRMGGVGIRRLRSGNLSRFDRPLRGAESQHLPALQYFLPTRRGSGAGSIVSRRLRYPVRQRQGFHDHAGGAQAEPAGAVCDGADSLLHFAGGSGSCLLQPADLPVRHGAGRRRLHHFSPAPRLFV